MLQPVLIFATTGVFDFARTSFHKGSFFCIFASTVFGFAGTKTKICYYCCWLLSHGFLLLSFFCWNYHLIVLEVTFFVATAFAFCYDQGSFLLHPCMAPESARNTGDDDGEGRQPAARGGNRRQGRGPARGGNRRQGRGRRQARSAMDTGCWSTHERRHEDEAVRLEDAASSGWA